MTGERSPAQREAIAQILRIMAENGLDAEDIRQDSGPAEPDRLPAGSRAGGSLGHLVLRVFYYLGGTLIFAGLGIYINTVWHDLGSSLRVLVTLGTGLTAYLLGVLFARDKHLNAAATPAHIVAFVLQPTGVFVLLREYFHGNDTALGAMVVFGPLAVQQFLTFLALKRSSLLLFSLLYAYGFLGAAAVHFSFDPGVASLACGLFLFFVAVDVHRRQAYREAAPPFFALGSSLILGGIYYHAGRTIHDPLMLSVSLGFLLHGVLSGSKTLYVLSCFYVAAYFCGGPGGWYRGNAYHRQYYEWTAVFTGASLALAGHWLSRLSLISASPLWLFAGAALALSGVFNRVRDTALEPLFAAAATLAIYAGLALRSRAMLASAILSLLSFIIYYANRHFSGSVSWPLLVVLFGFIILLAGFAFARLSARIKERALS